MMKKCLNCDKQFDGVERKFCSWQCDENYKKVLRTKIDDAISKDNSHTDNLSKDK
ncbi:hypothetical protein [Candidatus Nitrosotenuis chungbukensis]|nr:hypothetical protein [Candidatus Nitrosotenuis chungbukensis]